MYYFWDVSVISFEVKIFSEQKAEAEENITVACVESYPILECLRKSDFC